MQLEALDPLASKRVAKVASKGQSRGPGVVVDDRDDLFQGDDDRVV